MRSYSLGTRADFNVSTRTSAGEIGTTLSIEPRRISASAGHPVKRGCWAKRGGRIRGYSRKLLPPRLHHDITATGKITREVGRAAEVHDGLNPAAHFGVAASLFEFGIVSCVSRHHREMSPGRTTGKCDPIWINVEPLGVRPPPTSSTLHVLHRRGKGRHVAQAVGDGGRNVTHAAHFNVPPRLATIMVVCTWSAQALVRSRFFELPTSNQPRH